MQSIYKKLIKPTVSLSLFAIVLSFSNFVNASKGGEVSDSARVITLKPDQVTAIKGAKISSYSLAAVSGGRMTAIPYQFDERTQSGYVFMKDLDKKYKEEDPLLGNEGFFDENDELIFMLKDAGPRRKNGMSADGLVISEIEISTYDKHQFYVYIIEGARLESEC